MRFAFWKRDPGADADTQRDALPVLGQYVGRAAEVARFEEDLRDPQKVVVAISGENGLGKTTLLRRFQQRAAASDVITASTDRTGQGVPAMLGSLADELKQRGRPLRSFTERYTTYRQRMNELEADPQAPKGLAALAAGTLAKGGVRAARHLPVAGLAFELVPEDAAASAASELATYVIAKVGNKDEVELVLEPVPVLSRLFLEDVRAVADGGRIGLFLDADETAQRDVEGWVLDVVRETYGELKGSIIVAIASPRELDRGDWVSFEARVDRITLGPLTEGEARLYLEQAGVTNDAVVEEILRRSSRIPLLLALLAAERPETLEQIGDPNGTAVDGHLSSVGDPLRRQLAVDGSIPRVVNRDVLSVVLGRDDVLDDFVWLTRLPFLKDTDQGWVYTEPVRNQLIRRSRRDAPQSWTGLERKLADYYDGLAGELSLDDSERELDAEWQRHELEATYHALCAGPRQARRRALNGFVSAFAADRRFAQLYGAAVRQAGEDTGHVWLSELGSLLTGGTAAIDGAGWPEAKEMFEALLASGELEDVWCAKALDWRGYVRTMQGEFDTALPDFDAAVELEPDSVEYRLDRARVLQLLGRYDEALRDLDRAVSVEPDNPLALSLRAETYQFADRMDEELEDVKRVLELQPNNAAAWMMQADVLQVRGDRDGALESLDRALAIEPDNAQAWAAHGRVQLARGRPEEALRDLDEAVQRAPDDFSILSFRGNLLARSGKIDEAAKVIRELIERTPEFYAGVGEILSSFPQDELRRRSVRFATMAGLEKSEATRQLASLAAGPEYLVRVLEADLAALEALKHVRDANFEAAIADYRRGLEIDPERSPLWIAKAQLELQAGNVDEAAADFDRAVETGPENGPAWVARGQFHLSRGELDEALADIDRAIALVPNMYTFVSVRAVICQAKGDLACFAECAHILAAHAEEYVDQTAAAARVAAAAGSASPTLDNVFGSGFSAAAASEVALFLENPEEAARMVRAGAPMADAVLLADKGDSEGAIAAWTSALEIAGLQVEPLFQRGELRRRAGRLDEALADFDQALELDDASAVVHGSRGQVLAALGRPEEALPALDRALELDDTLFWVYLERGELHRLSGRLEEALADFDRMLELQPESAVAHGSRGQVLRRIGREEEALAALDRALQLDDTLFWVYLERGELHRLSGRLEEALADFDRMLELQPESAVAHGSRGQVLAALGRPEEALAALDRALGLDETLLWARQERGDVYLALERPDDALAEFSRVLGADQDDVPSLVGHGRALLSLSRFDEALSDLDRAIELAPEIAFSYGIRGEIRYLRRDTDGALADFARATELAPEWYEAQSRLSETLLLAGRADEALNAIEAALRTSSDDAWLHYVRALAHRSLAHPDAAQRDFDEAIAAAEKTGQDDPDPSRTLLNEAVYRLARGAPGDEDEAKRLFEEVTPVNASHRWEVVRDLETLSSLSENGMAATIAARLASDAQPTGTLAGSAGPVEADARRSRLHE